MALDLTAAFTVGSSSVRIVRCSPEMVRSFTDANGWYAVNALRRLQDGGSQESRIVRRHDDPHRARL